MSKFVNLLHKRRMMDYLQWEVKLNLKEIKYKITQKVVDTFIATDEEVMIFGGWCRDKILHDHAAIKFYKSDLDHEKYNDPTYDPVTSDRLLIARDIDIFVRGNEDTINRLLSNLTQGGLIVKQKIMGNTYLNFAHNIQHYKYTFSTHHSDFFPFPVVNIDLDILLIDKEINPPFGTCDLECNALLYDKNGFHLSRFTGTVLDDLSEINHKLAEMRIVKDLLEHKTAAFKIRNEDKEEMSKSNINRRKLLFKRILSMQLRDWTVTNIKNYVIEKIPEGDNTGKHTCSICNKPIEEVKIKLQCCNLETHPDCFRQHILNEYSSKSSPKCIDDCNGEFSII